MIQTKEHINPLQSIWVLLFSIVILHNIMPVVGRFISSYLTTYFMLLVVLAIFYYFTNWRLRWWGNLLTPLIIILLIQFLNNQGQPIVARAFGVLLTICPILIGLRTDSMPSSQIKILFRVMAVGVLITVVTTISGLTAYPGAARLLATFADSNDPRLIQFEWLNIGGFSFTYILVTLYPIIIGFIRMVYDKLWIKVVIILLFARYFQSAEYTTALMAFILISSLWFIPKGFPTKKLFLWYGFGVILFSIFKDNIANLFYDSALANDSTVFQERFQYVADGLAGVENTSDVGYREKALMTSVQGILRSPILGNWYKTGGIGGHSYILDFISLYGIVGWILIVKSYKVIYRQFYQRYEDTPYFSYALMSFVTAIILSIVNTGNHWLELTLFVPLTLEMITLVKAKVQ